MRSRLFVLRGARALPWTTRLAVLLAIAVAAIPAALVAGSELGLTSGVLAAAGAHPFALGLGAAAAVGTLAFALVRPRTRSLRA
jgi:predicted ABC-type sugar transport system permease subunit